MRQDDKPGLSLEQLNLSAETQRVLQEGMAPTGASDLLSYKERTDRDGERYEEERKINRNR